MTLLDSSVTNDHCEGTLRITAHRRSILRRKRGESHATPGCTSDGRYRGGRFGLVALRVNAMITFTILVYRS